MGDSTLLFPITPNLQTARLRNIISNTVARNRLFHNYQINSRTQITSSPFITDGFTNE